ncbi:MAG: CRISPR-associated endonuclease Cas2 [Phycisphaerae bacterium]|nr:CRISPR-associated endonuclease Cas2 [Phycisphaerae bacterium]
MMVLITYDVNTETPQSQKRLRHVAKICENRGQRVQKSVFECLVNPAQWVEMRQKLTTTIDPQTDSLRFYFLGSNWKRRVEHIGAKPSYDPQGPMIV